jgi:hypothetical protein
MRTHAVRRILVVAAALAALGAGAAEAQEWKIYLAGKVEPIVASFYAEESPWVFYRDDDSMYVFAVGCNRIRRVERGGTEIPPPRCPVERLPTTMPRIYAAIVDLEAKRLEDSVEKLRALTRSYNDALITDIVARYVARVTGEDVPRDAGRSAIGVLEGQINSTVADIQLSQERVEQLLNAAGAFPPRSRQRYYFAPK